MYNQYLPQNEDFVPVEPENGGNFDHLDGVGHSGDVGDAGNVGNAGNAENQPGIGAEHTGKAGFHLPHLDAGKESLSSLLKTLKLDNIDSGDLLLLLIILFLLVEGDDLELVIALGLVLLMGLGEGK
jgi:hypothetical protein